MAYGTLKVDNITYTSGGSDASTSVSGIVALAGGNFNNITATGTISGVTITGITANFNNGNYTGTLSGATVTGNVGQFTNVSAGAGNFTSVTGTTITGGTVNFNNGNYTGTLSGATVTGNIGQFTNVSVDGGNFTSVTGATITGTTVNAVSANFTTSVTGTTVTGTTANFSSGVFTTQVSGLTVTGTTANFTTGNVQALNVSTSGVFSSGIRTSGFLSEQLRTVAGKLSDNTNIDLSSGMVHFFTTQETTTSTPNFRFNSTTSLDSQMAIGSTVAATVVVTSATGGYSASMNIDGSGTHRTLRWQGGTTPTAGSASGVDVYAYQILKTAANTFTVFVNKTNFV